MNLYDVGSMAYSAYNNAPSIVGGINLVYEQIYGTNDITHIRPEPFGGLICGLALAVFEPENIKPRETFQATLIFDKDRKERIDRNGGKDYPKASSDLIIDWKRIVEISLMIFPPGEAKDNSYRIIYEFAIKGLNKLMRTYETADSKATVKLLQDCADTIQLSLNGTIVVKPSGDRVKEADIEHIKKTWNSTITIDAIAQQFLRGEENLLKSGGNYDSCRIQRKVIKYLILQQCVDYVKHKSSNLLL